MSTVQETTLDSYLDQSLKDPRRAIGFIEASKAEAYPGCVYHALVSVFSADPEFIPVLLPAYAKDLNASELQNLSEAYPSQSQYIGRYLDTLKALLII